MENFDASMLIAKARKASALTQFELAARAGTSQSAIARYERGVASPSEATLKRLLSAAGFELEVSLKKTSSTNLDSERARKLRTRRGEINRLLKAANCTRPHIFGSVARGEDSQLSDIDILVEFDTSNGLGKIVNLNRELSKLLKEKVEVSPKSILKKSILERALKDAVPL